MSTTSDELAATNKAIAQWTAEITSGNISVFTLDRLADARGRQSALEVLTLAWPTEERRRAGAQRGLDEARQKATRPGAAAIMAQAHIDINTRFLAGQLTIG